MGKTLLTITISDELKMTPTEGTQDVRNAQ